MSVRKLVSSEATEEELQLVFARTFSDLNNCQVSTVMEHLSAFLRTKEEIDVPPDSLCAPTT